MVGESCKRDRYSTGDSPDHEHDNGEQAEFFHRSLPLSEGHRTCKAIARSRAWKPARKRRSASDAGSGVSLMSLRGFSRKLSTVRHSVSVKPANCTASVAAAIRSALLISAASAA